MKCGAVVFPLLAGAALLACSSRANPGLDFPNRDASTTSDSATPTVDVVASDVPALVDVPASRDGGARQTVDVVLWTSGDQYRAEVRNQTSGAIVALNVRYTLPATGVAGMLGWMLRNPARVERLQVGTPSDAVRRVFENPDY